MRNFDIGERVLIHDPILFSVLRVSHPHIIKPLRGRVVRRVHNIHYVLIDNTAQREEIVMRMYLEKE